MLVRGRCILNGWKKNFLFTSIYSCLHFILPYLDEALIVYQFIKATDRSSPNERVKKIF